MKSVKSLYVFIAVAVVLPAWLSGEPILIEESAVLRDFDFYEEFGNEGVKIDSENLTMMFLHYDSETRINSYKSFRLDVQEPEIEETVVIDELKYQQDVVEFNLIPEQHNELTNNRDPMIMHESSQPQLDLDKAMRKFRKIDIPDKYRINVLGGMSTSFRNVRITEHKNEDGARIITKFEYFYITENKDGSLTFKIDTLIPKEPILSESVLKWEEIIPFYSEENEDEESDQDASDTTEPQASTNSLQGWYTYIQADKHYPWSEFKNFMMADVSIYIVRWDDVEDGVSEITSDFALRSTLSWWIDKFWAEDYSLNIGIENEIFYREDEESSAESLDYKIAEDEIRGGFVPIRVRNPFVRQVVDTVTRASGEKEDLWGIFEVSLILDMDADWDNDAFSGFGRGGPRGIDTDAPDGFNFRWTLNEKGENADDRHYRIKLYSSVQTRGIS